jgi:hypothetical protein
VSRFRIDHPPRKNVHAIYGHDPVLGFFVDVFMNGRDKPIASYDFFQPAFNRARPLMGCLDFLVEQEFFTADDLEDALAHVQDGTPVPAGRLAIGVSTSTPHGRALQRGGRRSVGAVVGSARPVEFA